jgi:hypothetical protein
MSDLKCSFCLSEDDDRKYLTSDDGKACVCSNCAMMLTQYVLQEREQDSSEPDSKNQQKNSNSKALADSEYPYLTQINIGLIQDGTEDLIECMNIPTILILSNDDGEKNLVILSEEDRKEFNDIYDAYDFCAKFLSELGIANLSKEKILGLITSAADEDEDGMYEIIQNEGGEVLLSQSMVIENLIDQAEDSLANSDLINMPFCLVQYSNEANIKIKNGNLFVNDDSIEMSEITILPGYMDWMANKVCIHVKNNESQKSHKDSDVAAEDDKNIKFQDYLVALEDKWMEKNVINTFIIDCDGSLNAVHFRFEDDDDDDDDGYYLLCELEVENIDSLPDDVEENILNEIEYAFDEIREGLEEEGLDLDAYLGEKVLLNKVN